MIEIDHLTADVFSALGDNPLLIVDAARHRPPTVADQAIVIGLDEAGALPDVDPTHFDLLLTGAGDPPAPWVNLTACSLPQIEMAIRANPVAATILCQTLRLAEMLPFDVALQVESLAYSTVLGGAEFRRWRNERTDDASLVPSNDPLVIEREDDRVTMTLNDPTTGNAMTATMRDALYGALANALDDPTKPTVLLKGAGKCFSTGGHIPEFGTAADLAQAHVVRTLHSCARMLRQLDERATVRLHGACIGSGLEVPAAAHRRVATANSWFQLPELRMGLIPGAGGTVTVSRAIGRHRTAWMVLSGRRIKARQALDWGLIHEIVA